ncbi:fungal-specific transcription factor domain-containing protein [Lasiosphaeris hirsuta]|uniref:Fungal-specific transcription factor domain-containing protein n=1 Tax=Lasiosphaeris hirsuta TaxID=260670 RepID=A0AA39ZRH3_9PEZI|nr:fungal-specific transcription factor domain-containing protein [Lasiosphaeris hirsuta]
MPVLWFGTHNVLSSVKIAQTTVKPTEGPAQLELGSSLSGLPNQNKCLSLPPLAVLLPYLDDYFTNFNAIVPLFDKKSFMGMINQSGVPECDDTSIIALVNVVLALTYRHRATTRPPIPCFDTAACITNAQAAINSPSNSRHGLCNLQVLLGLAILEQGIPHQSRSPPTTSYIASAIKLAHGLGLHQSETNALLDPEESCQRVRVFWIAYIFDRDINIRKHEPPLQQERDHDIPIPCAGPGDSLVRFTSASGMEVQVDFLQLRIHLAYVQNTIYEQMYSVYASSQTVGEREHNIAKIHAMLGAWMAAVPPELHPDRLAGASPQCWVRQLVALYFAYFACFQHTHRVGSYDAEWVTRLVNYSHHATDPGSDERVSTTGPGLAVPTTFSEPSAKWGELVSTARQCGLLFRLVDPDDNALIWTTSCTYLSAALVLIANTMTVSTRGAIEDGYDGHDSDAQLVAEVVAFLKRAAVEVPDLQAMHAALAELSCRARSVHIRSTWSRPGPKPASVAWLEGQARRTAQHSALALVEAFTSSDVKPLATRLRHSREVAGHRQRLEYLP